MIERIETIEVHQRCNDGSWAWENTAGVLIRCKDCRFWEQEQRDKGFGDCMYHLSLTQASDFCSYAERKEKIQ